MINNDSAARREEAWIELHRRPDAPPLPDEPANPAPLTRLIAAVRTGAAAWRPRRGEDTEDAGAATR